MLFTRFTNRIYTASELTSYFITLLQVYIVWREYIFIGSVKDVLPEMRPYMKRRKFEKLKAETRKDLLIQLINDSWRAAFVIIFSDELAHISLWTLSLRMSGGDSDAMLTTCVFIFLTTCKDFFLELPITVYYLMEGGSTLGEAFRYLSLTFCVDHLRQQVLLNSLVFSASQFPYVSSTCLILTSTLVISGLMVTREVFLSEVVIRSVVKPFTDAQIMREIRPYLKKMNFPEKNVFLFETDQPNAFSSGHWVLGNQRIGIADNIIGKNRLFNGCCTRKEVVAILMHEIGHVFYNHTTKSALLEFFISSSTSAIFILLYRDIVFESFGFNSSRPVIVGMLVRMDLLLGYNMLCGLVYMIDRRHHEYQADFFSYTFTGNCFRSALIKLHSTMPHNLLVHDSWYSTWNFGHPSLIERLNYLTG